MKRMIPGALSLAILISGMSALPSEAATYRDGACAKDEGITLVVDYLSDPSNPGIITRCIRPAIALTRALKESGDDFVRAPLKAAGISYGPEQGKGSVVTTINGVTSPRDWSMYWHYSVDKADGSGTWDDKTWPLSYPDDSNAHNLNRFIGITLGSDKSVPQQAPTFGESSSRGFSDVETGTMFHAEIVWLAQQGITTGYEDGTYRPLNSVNRDAMAAFLYRMAGSPDYTAPQDSPFVDVPTNSQFYTEICWLADQGITTGWPDKTFRPVTPVARDAMAAFLYRYASTVQGVDVSGFTPPQTSPFTDVPAGSQFYTEISWLADRQISTGWPDKTFRPLNPIARDAMAAFLYRMAG